MKKIALLLIALISALHFYIAWFEIFTFNRDGNEVVQPPIEVN